MKKYLLILSLFIVGLSACQKVDVVTDQAAIDDAKIQAYFKANNVTGVTKDASGLYFKILKQGTAPNPKLTSTVQLTYTNTYLNGILFDHVDVATYVLNASQKGLQIGIPKIGVGGRIMLYVPSELGYGSDTQSTVPGNSILIYTIDLVGYY